MERTVKELLHNIEQFGFICGVGSLKDSQDWQDLKDKTLYMASKITQIEPQQKRKFTVYFMTPYMQWDNVEAYDEEDAINQCNQPPEFDSNEPATWLALEQTDTGLENPPEGKDYHGVEEPGIL